jgi:hypothetical protein
MDFIASSSHSYIGSVALTRRNPLKLGRDWIADDHFTYAPNNLAAKQDGSSKHIKTIRHSNGRIRQYLKIDHRPSP